MLRLKPVPVQVFTWVGQPPSDWPDWITAMVLQADGVMILRDQRQWEFMLARGDSLVKTGTKALHLLPAEFAELIEPIPAVDTAPAPQVPQATPAPAPTGGVTPPPDGYPPLPYTPLDQDTVFNYTTKGDLAYRVKANDTRYVTSSTSTLPTIYQLLGRCIMLENGKAGASFMHFRAADRNYYSMPYSTWNDSWRPT